jgi:low affinity Fe/Cu permease
MSQKLEMEQGGKQDKPEKHGLAHVRELFRRFCRGASVALGTQWAFLSAIAIIVIWAATGPLAGFSDTWQLIINTGTTIITFLMVFLIQNTQNRDGRAVQLKLDELIHSIGKARNRMVDLEDCSDEELDELEAEFKRVRSRHLAQHQNGSSAAPQAGHAADNHAHEAAEAAEIHG